MIKINFVKKTVLEFLRVIISLPV